MGKGGKGKEADGEEKEGGRRRETKGKEEVGKEIDKQSRGMVLKGVGEEDGQDENMGSSPGSEGRTRGGGE